MYNKRTTQLIDLINVWANAMKREFLNTCDKIMLSSSIRKQKKRTKYKLNGQKYSHIKILFTMTTDNN